MASSSEKIITPITTELLKLNPKTVLDVGFGYGKWGYIIREYLEAWKDRIDPKDWIINITGIDAWKPFSKLPWNIINYNKIIIGDALEEIKKLGNYELVIITDVLEHLIKGRSIELFEECLKRANRCFITSIPIGKVWLHNKIVYDNPYNAHKCIWEIEEIKKYNPTKLTTVKGVRGDIAIAIFKGGNK